MRISDWSSDVCSSDIAEQGGKLRTQRNTRGSGKRCIIDHQLRLALGGERKRIGQDQPPFGIGVTDLHRQPLARRQHVAGAERSEERRVGKEGVSTGGCRWSAVY